MPKETGSVHVEELKDKIAKIMATGSEIRAGGPFWFNAENITVFKYGSENAESGYCSFLLQSCHKPAECEGLMLGPAITFPDPEKDLVFPCGCKIVCATLPEIPPDNVQEVVEEMIQKACKRMAALSDEKTPCKFSNGDVVVENNANMRMTVEISDDPRSVGCVWFDEEDHLHRAKFDENDLNTTPPVITPEVAHD